MARPKSVVPAYRHHAGTGQAVTTVTGPNGARKDVYLGPYGSDTSKITYGRVLIEWKSAHPADGDGGAFTINELILAI